MERDQGILETAEVEQQKWCDSVSGKELSQ